MASNLFALMSVVPSESVDGPRASPYWLNLNSSLKLVAGAIWTIRDGRFGVTREGGGKISTSLGGAHAAKLLLKGGTILTFRGEFRLKLANK